MFVVLYLAGLVLVSAGASEVFAQKYGKITDEEWQVQAPPEYPEANAVILFDHGCLEVTSDIVSITCHVRIKVLTDAGISDVGERTISYFKDYDKVKDLRAHTLTPDGRKFEVKRDAVFEKEMGDLGQQILVFPAVTPGCIVDYEYRLISERWNYLPLWYFQNELWTNESRFTLELHPGFTYDVDYQNVPVQLQKSQDGRRQRDDGNTLALVSWINTFTWSMNDLPPVTSEPYMSC